MKNLIFLFLLAISFNGVAQFSGYYGKKTYVDVAYKFFVPIFGNLKNYGYNKNLNERRDWFNYGYRLNLSRMVSNQVSIGLEFNQDFAEANFPTEAYIPTYANGYLENYPIYGAHENIDISTITIMPKIGFNSRGILPLGITHEFGIGYSITSIKERDYNYEFFYDYYFFGDPIETYTLTNETNGPLIDFDKTFKGFTLLYGISVKKNITKTLFLNYGFRYTFNWLVGSGNYYGLSSNNDISYNQHQLYKNIRHQRVFNFVTGNIGLTFAF